MLKLNTFEFRNSQRNEMVRIMAVDGHSAWNWLAELVGVPDYRGSFIIPLPNAWSILSVCPCGKASNHAFCSETCFRLARKGD